MDGDPEEVRTVAGLSAALDFLRGTRSYGDLGRAARRLGKQLPKGTLSGLLSGKTLPRWETVECYLTVCGVPGEAQGAWLVAWKRLQATGQRTPDNAERVRNAQALAFGPGSDLPPYVERDFDDALGAALEAIAGGGVLVVSGAPTTGRTRSLYEALKTAVGDWWLIRPPDGAALAAFAAAPTKRTVVWLDRPGAITYPAAAALADAGVIVVATTEPDDFRREVAAHPGLRSLARVVEVPTLFSEAERLRAAAARSHPRIRLALAAGEIGLTQALAVGPELVRWWRDGPAGHSFGRAVLTAALDARRVGALAPLSREFLLDAAVGYLTPRQRAKVVVGGADQALDYATTELRGITPALIPIGDVDGTTLGYDVAGYLDEYARRVRRTEPLPDIAWDALVRLHDPGDTLRLARHAARRGRPAHAEALLRQAVVAGTWGAVDELVELLLGRGLVDDAVEVLRRYGDNDRGADRRLLDLLIKNERIDDLRTLADDGDWGAAHSLFELLVERGEEEQALDVFRRRVRDGHDHAVGWLTRELAARDRVDEAVAVFRERVEAGVEEAAQSFAVFLGQHGRVDELRELAGRGDARATYALVHLLDKQGLVEEAATALRPLADEGDDTAEFMLVRLWSRHGLLEQVRERARAGGLSANHELPALLARLGHIDEAADLLRAAGETNRLAALLAECGRTGEAIHVLEEHGAGAGPGAMYLAKLLAVTGRLEDALDLLDRRADDPAAAAQRINLLIEHERLDLLATLADSGDAAAALRLAELLVARARPAEAADVLRRAVGDRDGNSQAHHSMRRLLANLLLEMGAVEELRARADHGDDEAGYLLLPALAASGRIGELQTFAEQGDSQAAALLSKLGHRDVAISAMRTFLREADADDPDVVSFARMLARMILEHGDLDEAVRLVRRYQVQDSLFTQTVLGDLVIAMLEKDRSDEAVTLLRAIVERDDGEAAEAAQLLTELLVDRGELEQGIAVLRGRADHGGLDADRAAAQLCDLLATHNRYADLMGEVAAGTAGAAQRLDKMDADLRAELQTFHSF